MSTHRLLNKPAGLLLGLMLSMQAFAQTDISTSPLSTFSAPSTTDVKPNVLFVLDDSGSMSWDYMPDWADVSDDHLFRNNSFNGVAYDPGVRYDPPITYNSSGAVNTTTYPSMTGQTTATGASSAAKPNWRAVKNDGYGVQTTGTANLEGSSYAYVIIPGEYCNSASMTNCVTASAPTGNYTFPSYLRWCSNSALTTCRATYSSTYNRARIPSPRTATITVSSSGNSTSVSGVTVNGVQIMAATTSATSTTNTIASRIADQINACTNSVSGNCGTAGYSASSSGATVTITAPGIVAVAPVVTKGNTGTKTFTTTAFSQGSVAGENLRHTITSGINSYAYPGSSTKGDARTDCAGTTCTYVEEMTNYANWRAYYRTRMQMMKTAVSNAFATIDSPEDLSNGVSRFRLGYLSINNATNSDFLNLDEFKTSHKYNWYRKLQNANPSGGTPLRVALSTAGRLYAGKLNGTTLNGSTVTDPLQFSCQQNFTILSSDGYWNLGYGKKLDNSNLSDNHDGALPRPMNDGATSQVQTRTSTLQTRSVTITRQSRTGTLQTRTWSGLWIFGSWSSWSNASTCVEESGQRECRYNWGNWTNNASCVTVDPSPGSPYTVATAVECRDQESAPSTWVNTTSCTETGTTQCRYSGWTSWSNVTSCTPTAQSGGPNYTVSTARECQVNITGGTSGSLADVAAYYYGTDLRQPGGANDAGTCTGPIIAPNTTPNDLCANNVPSSGLDVANTQHMTTFTLGLGSQGQMVYSPTYWLDTSGDFYDVRMGTTANPSAGICSWQSSGVCNWPTPSSGEPSGSSANITHIDDLWHAAINGRGSYFSATDPDSLAKGLTDTLKIIVNTPRPGTAAAAASSNPNITSSDNYVFSSSYKSVEWYGELIRQQINDAGQLTAPQWSAMRLLDCATTPWTANTAYALGSNYRHSNVCYTVTEAYSSGAAFGAADTNATSIVPGTPITRNIYTKNGNDMVSFTWANLSAAQRAMFTKPAIAGLSQFCTSGPQCLGLDHQNNTTVATDGAAGEAMINFLRGDRSNEGRFYRTRIHVLGDIVASEARYVKTPMFRYADAGYADYKAAQISRTSMVYAGGNDGMLHAFNADNGQEAWAYIPSMLLPDLHKLADKDYASKHQFYVDNSPEVGDICPTATCTGAQWKTILVGGLNRGGKGYYALDITNPASPQLLWEFTDATLGYSYGNPRITKLKDGTWVVILTSGYNNADGIGRLYVLNAATGAVIRTISTGVGTTVSPSGLARISAHAREPMTNNTVQAVYGGDLLGNLWRFDVNGDIGASGYDAHRLVTFRDAANNPQPITAKPLEATINGKPVVYVGTGRFLGTSDVADARTQSFYAVKDNLDAVTLANPRSSGSNFVAQTLTAGTCPTGTASDVCAAAQAVRTSSNNPVNWNSHNGFYLDFVTGGERASTDPSLGLGTLVFTTVTPQVSSVSACGADTMDVAASYFYAIDYKTGGAVIGTNGVSGVSLGAGMVTRPILVAHADGTVRALIRASLGGSGDDMGNTLVRKVPVAPPSMGTRRISWRELTAR